MIGHLVAQIHYHFQWEIRVLHLGFLDTNDIWLLTVDQRLQLMRAGTDAVGIK